MSLGVSDVPTDVENAGNAGDIIEHGLGEVGVFTHRLLVVAVPVHGLVEHVDEVGTSAENLVVMANELAMRLSPRELAP